RGLPFISEQARYSDARRRSFRQPPICASHGVEVLGWQLGPSSYQRCCRIRWQALGDATGKSELGAGPDFWTPDLEGSRSGSPGVVGECYQQHACVRLYCVASPNRDCGNSPLCASRCSEKSSTLTWTPSTRRSSSGIIRRFEADQWQWGARPSAASCSRPATKLGSSACVQPCHPRRLFGSVRSSFLCRRALTSIAPFPNTSAAFLRTILRSSSRYRSMRPILM